MFEEFPYKIGPTKVTPWPEKLLKIDHSAPKLDEERRKKVHRFVMKCMFLCKRARPDIDQGVSFLSSRVKEANEGDWTKLLRVLGFLKGNIDDVLKLEADDTNTLTWYIDATFAVHEDMKSYTGALLRMPNRWNPSDAFGRFPAPMKVQRRSLSNRLRLATLLPFYLFY
jgi:hypothetical protein